MTAFSRSIPILLGIALLAGPAGAATVSVTLGSSGQSSCENGTADGTNESNLCFQDGTGSVDDWSAVWSASGGTSPNLVGVGSTAVGFFIDAAVAADDGGSDVGSGNDRWIHASLNFVLDVDIDVDNAGDTWSLDLGQGALGLFALKGDGALTAVGTQDPGFGRVSGVGFTVAVSGNLVGFSVAPSSISDNPSNTGSSSAQFSGSRSVPGLLAGVGDASLVATIAFGLEAFSNDGCSGILCSSPSGGEEAAVLFGLGGGLDGVDADDYAFWGRSQAPDGYSSTWTLHVTSVVPEPGSLGLVALGLVGLVVARGRA